MYRLDSVALKEVLNQLSFCDPDQRRVLSSITGRSANAITHLCRRCGCSAARRGRRSAKDSTLSKDKSWPEFKSLVLAAFPHRRGEKNAFNVVR